MLVWKIPALVAVLPGVVVHLAWVRGKLQLAELQFRWPWWRRS
jgi:hypothetical protein